MAHPDSLIAGKDYFLVHYYDNDLLVPDISTLQYQGAVETEDGEQLWSFSTPNYSGDVAEEGGDEIPVGFNESQLYQILDFDGLINVLKELRAVRPNSMIPPSPIEAHALLSASPLAARIEEFLEAPSSTQLYISIRYRDQGFFLKKTVSGLQLHLFTHPLRAADVNSRITSLIRDRGLTATTDYLSDKGRTRILHYPLPIDFRLITELAAEILTIGYAMSDRDEIIFSDQ